MEKELWSQGEEKVEPSDESIYSQEVRDQLLEDDEISSGEGGFMEGYDRSYEEGTEESKEEDSEGGYDAAHIDGAYMESYNEEAYL